MLEMYCKAHHDYHGKLCDSCEELSQYSYARLKHCPFQEMKPTCGKCSVHCYKKNMRDQVKKVMRWAGPRMIFSHPILAFKHLLQGMRKPPQITNSRRKQQ